MPRDTILTLAAPPGQLPPALVARVAAALHTHYVWLAEGEAADLKLAARPAPALLASLLHATPTDYVVQSAARRRRRLLVADMDSTIVETETLDELAVHAGFGQQVAAITTRSMRGETDFRTALIERVAMLKGLPEAALEATWQATPIMAGAADLVATMAANGVHCALVSGGFTWFTERLAARLGFHSHHANRLLVRDGLLTGAVAEPILGREGKAETLRSLAASLSIPLTATLAVGDGANDLDMLNLAGLGVAYRAKPLVAQSVSTRVSHCSLRALLFFQGYRPSKSQVWEG